MEGDPCLSGRRGKDEEELVRIYLRDGSQGLLFSRGQVPGLPSCAQSRLWSKESSRADTELRWAVNFSSSGAEGKDCH